MHTLELKIPPPVVALLLALAMWAAARLLPPPDVSDVLRLTVTLVFAVLGAAFDLSGLLAFRRARTTINPMTPRATSALVRTGVYRITRNPMYVGLVCLLFAWAAFLWMPWGLLGPLAFVGYISRFQIAPEERAMAEKFGADYETYRAQVRRWI